MYALLLGCPDKSHSNYWLHDVLKFPTNLLENVPTNSKISKVLPSLGSLLLLELPTIKYNQLRRFKSSRMWHYGQVHSLRHSFTALRITHPKYSYHPQSQDLIQKMQVLHSFKTSSTTHPVTVHHIPDD